QSLGLPWVGDLLRDQQTGGGITWGGGEIPLLLIMVTLAVQWARSDQRQARQHDRREARDHDAELAAYNAMFQELARRDNDAVGRRTSRGCDGRRRIRAGRLAQVAGRRFGGPRTSGHRRAFVRFSDDERRAV